MRILQIHNYYAIPGGECGVVDAERALLESRGHEVTQFSRNSKMIAQAPLSEKIYDFARLGDNGRVARELTQLLAANVPDVAHVHNVFPLLSPSVYTVLRRHNVPVVQTVHNFRFICPAGTLFVNGRICERCPQKGFAQAVRHRCVRGSIATSYQYARAVRRMWRTGVVKDAIGRYIVLNAFSRNKLTESGVPEEKVEVCGNFAAVIDAIPAEKERYVLFLGRLSPEKGLGTLIAAARKLHTGRVRIAGTGPLEGEVIKAAESGDVEFLGYIDGQSKRDLVRRATAVVVPSEWYENFPMSVIESMSMGTPVIASNIGGLPEMLTHGRSGLLFRPGDVDELAAHIDAVCADEAAAKALSWGALTEAAERFGSVRHAAGLERIYRDCIGCYSSVPRRRQG